MMRLNHLTQYRFSNEYGITGTLAADPTFDETKKGNEYAKFAIYCKAVDANDSNKNSHRRSKKLDTNTIPLIAYVRVFDENLLDDVDQLKKGYFINFTYDNIVWNLGNDTETDKLRVNPTFVANSFEVRHIPGEKRARQLTRKSKINGDDKRAQKVSSRLKK